VTPGLIVPLLWRRSRRAAPPPAPMIRPPPPPHDRVCMGLILRSLAVARPPSPAGLGPPARQPLRLHRERPAARPLRPQAPRAQRLVRRADRHRRRGDGEAAHGHGGLALDGRRLGTGASRACVIRTRQLRITRVIHVAREGSLWTGRRLGPGALHACVICGADMSHASHMSHGGSFRALFLRLSVLV
jgi:hypothetical protein